MLSWDRVTIVQIQEARVPVHQQLHPRLALHHLIWTTGLRAAIPQIPGFRTCHSGNWGSSRCSSRFSLQRSNTEATRGAASSDWTEAALCLGSLSMEPGRLSVLIPKQPIFRLSTSVPAFSSHHLGSSRSDGALFQLFRRTFTHALMNFALSFRKVRTRHPEPVPVRLSCEKADKIWTWIEMMKQGWKGCLLPSRDRDDTINRDVAPYVRLCLGQGFPVLSLTLPLPKPHIHIASTCGSYLRFVGGEVGEIGRWYGCVNPYCFGRFLDILIIVSQASNLFALFFGTSTRRPTRLALLVPGDNMWRVSKNH